MTASKVYFSDLRVKNGDNLLQKLQRLIKAAGIEKIDFENKYAAIKIHFGEPGNLAFIRPNYAKAVADVVKELGGKPFLTDCNTLYVGGRKNALDHLDSANLNGFNPVTTGCQILIADGLKGTDEALVPVEGGTYVKEAKIGRAIMDADIIISLNHFKGHEATGFGGRAGLRAGVCPKDAVLPASDESNDILNCKIAEYTKAVIQGRPNFHISLVIDVSPYCDCHGENDAAIVPNVGMFASFDPVALDVACADAVNAQPVIKNSKLGDCDEEERKAHHHDHFHSIFPETNWESAIEHGVAIGIGSKEYELITVK